MEKATDELSLILRIKEARQKADETDEAAKKAALDVEVAEAKLIEFMTDRGIKTTAKYEGIGFASLDKPELFARCNKPDQDRLFEYLASVGRQDLIKPSVHHKSLSGFVGELLEAGKSVPEFLQYGFKQTLKLYTKGA